MNKNKKALQTLIYQGFSRLFVWQGLQGLEVALQPLLRCPKSAGAPVGAADFDRCANPCSLCPPPAAVASVARHAPRAKRLSLFTQSKKKKHRLNRCFSFWQGQKDLNPRHAVLETAALPTELYPYVVAMYCATARFTENGGPSGTRTPDRPVMSRML